MGASFILFLILLFIFAAFTREPFAVNLFYFFTGIYLLSQFWTRRVAKGFTFKRHFTPRAFPGETVPVTLDVRNASWLPAVWVRLQDQRPLEISDGRATHQVISLGPHEQTLLTYQLLAKKRGYYPVGPLQIATGDLLGILPDRRSQGTPDYLTVFPRVLPLPGLRLPSLSPSGTLKHTQPIFEDPSRPVGKRDYQTGDSLRRVDWKTSAAVGKLQVKQFEPSIALETAIFLDLEEDSYEIHGRYDASELAVVTAASIANRVVQQKQAAGLFTNAHDPLRLGGTCQPLFPHKGRQVLITLLEVLARAELNQNSSLETLMQQHRVHLGWGATLVVISGSARPTLLDECLRARQSGMHVVLLLCGRVSGYVEVRGRAKRLGIATALLLTESDLEQWQK